MFTLVTLETDKPVEECQGKHKKRTFVYFVRGEVRTKILLFTESPMVITSGDNPRIREMSGNYLNP